MKIGSMEVEDVEAQHWDALQNWQRESNDLKGIEDYLRILLNDPGMDVPSPQEVELVQPHDEEGLPPNMKE